MRYALFAALVLASGTAAAAPASRWPLLSVGKNTRCGPFSKRALKRLPLLDGRLSIKAPRGSKDIPKTFSIMGAPEPKAHESRLLLDVAGTKLVVYVRELFHLAGGGYRHGRHLAVDPQKEVFSNLFVTMAQRMGVETEHFGFSTGVLDLNHV